MCEEGYFTAGTTCQKCPDSLALLIPVAIAALIGMGLLLYFLWSGAWPDNQYLNDIWLN